MKLSDLNEKEKQAMITLLEAKIERTTGKKIKYTSERAESKATKIKKIREELEKLTGKKNVLALKEGTWSLPNTPKKVQKAELAARAIEKMRNVLYDVTGDDEFFDHLDGAEKRLRELIQLGADEHTKTLDAIAKRKEADLKAKTSVEKEKSKEIKKEEKK